MNWIRAKQVIVKLGISLNGLKLLEAKFDDFPKPVRFSHRMKVYDEAAIDAWMVKTTQIAKNEVDHESVGVA